MILLGIFLWAAFNGHPWVVVFLFMRWLLHTDRKMRR